MRASLPSASSPEHCLPHIQFLFIGSRLCSTLLSDLASRFGPCASLSLHLHLVVKRTCTSQLSIMLGTQLKRGTMYRAPTKEGKRETAIASTTRRRPRRCRRSRRRCRRVRGGGCAGGPRR